MYYSTPDKAVQRAAPGTYYEHRGTRQVAAEVSLAGGIGPGSSLRGLAACPRRPGLSLPPAAEEACGVVVAGA